MLVNVSAFRVSLSRCGLRLDGLNHAFFLMAFFENHPVNTIKEGGKLQKVLHRIVIVVRDDFQDDITDDFAEGGQFDLQILIAAFFTWAAVALAGDRCVKFHG